MKGAFNMLKKLKLNLQLFGEGGDGGDGGSSASVGEAVGGTPSGDNANIPASIPEKARKYYQKAMEKNTNTSNKPNGNAPTTEENPTAEKKQSYDEFIKEHKEEHEAYMKSAISDRLKKYKGVEEMNATQRALLDIVANKYGVNPDSETYLQELAEKIEADDSYYESYAMEHDISPEEARRVVTMERKAAQYDAQKEAEARQEQARQQIMTLRKNAESTKRQFPNFDLDSEMQNEKFRKLCAVTNGDTTAAYMACHFNEIIPATVQMASQQIQAQTAQAVASNKARPIENGISSTAPSVVQQDFRNMSLAELRKYAQEQRNKTGR
jgi:hypothetical protein